jgi:hypothetical protein
VNAPLTRRDLLKAVASLPLISLPSIYNDSQPKDQLVGVWMHGKFIKQKKWDIVVHYIDGVCKAFPDIDRHVLVDVICEEVKKDAGLGIINWLSVQPGLYSYYLHVYYTNKDYILAVPIV